MSRTVFRLRSSETSEDGRLTKQFFRWTSESSAAADCAFFLETILSSAVAWPRDARKFAMEADVIKTGGETGRPADARPR